MKKFAEQLKARAEEIKLRTDERDALRTRLLAYMSYHPMAEEQTFSHRPARRRTFLRLFANGRFVSAAVGMTAVFCLVVIPAMAENSLPGDTLYPVKVRFNEELRGALASSPYQKIEWETERLERRVAEAQLLSDAGKLTPVAEAEVADAIKRHSVAAKESIDSIRESNKDDAAIAEITLSSSLEVSAEVLVKRNTSTSSTPTLANAVNEARANVASGNNNPSYDKLMSRIEADTTRAYEYLNSLGNVLSSEEKSDIERRLNDIKNKVEVASGERESDPEDSVKLLSEALAGTSKVISFITNLDVRKNVKIGDLIPAAPTVEEQRAAISTRLEETDKTMTAVEAGVAKLATTSTDYLELNTGVEQYDSLKQAVTEALNANNVAGAEKSLKEAAGLAEGLVNNLKVLGIEIELSATTSASSTNGRQR